MIVQTGEWCRSLGMCGTVDGIDWHRVDSASLLVTDPNHPILKPMIGLTNPQFPEFFELVDWVIPTKSAYSAASMENDSTQSLFFTCETGSALEGLTAPARRIYLPTYKPVDFPFAMLFYRSILWGINSGCGFDEEKRQDL